MRHKRLVCATAFIAAGICTILSPILQADVPPTPESLLKAAGVPLEPEALIAALDGNKDSVRAAAAMELATMNVKAAVSVLERDLEQNLYPQSRYPIVLSLEILGSPIGRDELRKYCTQPDSKQSFANMAAEALRANHDYTCASFMATGLLSKDDGHIEEALLYLRDVPAGEITFSVEEKNVLLKVASLSNEDSFYRQLAIGIIWQAGDDDLKTRYVLNKGF